MSKARGVGLGIIGSGRIGTLRDANLGGLVHVYSPGAEGEIAALKHAENGAPE